MAYENVGISIIAINATADINLPTTTSRNVTGIVSKISYDPTFNSSEKSLMVTAGIIKEKITGRREKKFLRFAWLWRKKVVKKNHPVTRRKIEMTI